MSDEDAYLREFLLEHLRVSLGASTFELALEADRPLSKVEEVIRELHASGLVVATTLDNATYVLPRRTT